MKQLGEKFEENGVTFEVVKAPNPADCTGCYFRRKFEHCGSLRCSADEREDGEIVIFKEVE